MRIVGVLLVLGLILACKGYNHMDDKDLTQQEARVLLGKGTEYAGTGFYNDFKKSGTFNCRNCDSPLFSSEAKFDSRSGWPSFDEALPDAVKEVPDSDGRRVEIVCASCGGHLGHVFKGEAMTKKNTRHCVNSLSLCFEASVPDSVATAYFAGGCFWGVEYYFEKVPGVVDAVSGYMGGEQENPTYKDVSGGKSGHLEVVAVRYDPRQVSYESLAKLFFEIHDPTQKNGQGPDIGEQYLSAVFVATDEERSVVENLIGQ